MSACPEHHVRIWSFQGGDFIDFDLEDSRQFVSAWAIPSTTFLLQLNFHLNSTWLLASCGVFCRSVFCAQTSLVKNKECLASSWLSFLSSTHALFCIPSEQTCMGLLWGWEQSLTKLCWNPGYLNKAHSSFPEGVRSIERSEEANTISDPEEAERA